MLKNETALSDTQQQLAREKQKSENLQKTLKDIENKSKNQLKTANESKDKISADRDELNK